MENAALIVLHALTHFILTLFLLGRYHDYHYITGEKTKVQRGYLALGHIVNKWQYWYLNSDYLMPKISIV